MSPLHVIIVALVVLAVVAAAYLLISRKPRGGSGADRADYTTDSPNDRPPAADDPRFG
ncbi:MAG TPA: hypothetical protein VL200_06650 [Lacunisphaera sp.]|jgi:hypothetical protein|nr:hypothetical protein [Lacunisphaera sp.]